MREGLGRATPYSEFRTEGGLNKTFLIRGPGDFDSEHCISSISMHSLLVLSVVVTNRSGGSSS